MKKILVVFAVFSLASCTNDDYANLNVDPKNPSEVPGSFLFTGGIKRLFDQMGSTSVNNNIFRLVAQHWTESQYVNETNYNIKNRGISDAYWDTLYTRVLYNLKKAKEYIGNDQTLLAGVRQNQQSMITIVEVVTWQQLVDTFGNIPYTQALQGTSGTTPVYDDAFTIYKDLLQRINTAYNNLDTASKGFDNDFVYNNNIAKWKKLAASIKFRLAMRLADVDPSLSKTEAEDAYNKGLISSNADNFLLNYENNTANANPLYADLVLSDRQDFLPSDTFVDYLNELQDPRRTVFLDDNKTPYTGGIYGDFNNYTLYSHIGKVFFTPTLKGDLLDYSEISFLLAEAKERGYNVPLAADIYYTQGITASMEYWKLSASDITEYLARPDVGYTTAPGSWKQKIGKQFWIAMYNRGIDAWNVWRMYDAPSLKLPVATKTPVPKRFTYPVGEVNLNNLNYQQASSAIGGDQQQTKIFWDKY
ncbi:SusD/RagB family nutrient-binding outer membrane lipoprotein [Chryseobacterium indologenes]|uniref:SusD/RagB family nutrient-binding outer membrane lipoprotein n=1 Tax=Chryseobacterium indologenes TaxID=253 RepID=UPI000CFDED3B|nr:SusD/RagB family nutrient-binding outer membrane lipoprotein [Chryseobacterium indologenes]AVK73278.1 SusD/RagB family nutrient-binding outer membrane lipoprotein [Chryseobacterium indologenes]